MPWYPIGHDHKAKFNLSRVVLEDWLAMLTAVRLGSNPGHVMNICKCIVHLGHGDTLTSRQAARPLVRLVEGEGRWDVPHLSLNIGVIQS
ncbi:hypothetical protein TNCV_2241131 [Trichonephila clavipes]|nr:hypothetical protein TNCV_2241131 [Trichonephila clavipes]